MDKPYWNSEIETMKLDKLKEIQLSRLKKLVRYVYDNNQFYHKKLKDVGIKPDSIKSLTYLLNCS